MKLKKYFNTEGICEPERHYMVNIDERLEEIKTGYVDRGFYFVINRGRQYGKTTTLRGLERYLASEYLTVFLDFQIISSTNFDSEYKFSKVFSKLFVEAVWNVAEEGEREILSRIRDLASDKDFGLDELFEQISRLCNLSPKPIVLIIDEVDSASNNQVFLDFLAVLRGYYLNRSKKAFFQSVILAGVYDIKNMKLKIRPAEEHRYNSPWNIAAEFNVPMNFSIRQIAEMLESYEKDKGTGMDVKKMAGYLFDYTSGYPYLVSALCKIMDEDREAFAGKTAWDREGIEKAVRLLLKKKTTLFDSLAKQMDRYPDLKTILEEMIYQGRRIPFASGIPSIDLGMMFGFLKEENGYVEVSNRIFEMLLLNRFIAEEAVESKAFQYGQRNMQQFFVNGRPDMEQVLGKFVEHFADLFEDKDEKFIEKYGRKFFLLYLKPIINGTGNYYIEAQTRDAGRTDVIVDYLGEQFVIELKIWHGKEYHERGKRQLAEYLDCYHLDKGYLLSFNFNKNKKIGVNTVAVGDKMIVEAVV